MSKIRYIFPLLLLNAFISACTDENNSSVIELSSPVSTRADDTVTGAGKFRIDVTINAGSPQTIYIDQSESPVPVIISDIRPNEQNSIDIVWYIILDGREVELSAQSQIFVAESVTLIDAPHTHVQFDFDNDGEPNLIELAAGTCLWSDAGPCVHPDSVNQNNSRTLFNEDFSNGYDNWWWSGNTLVETPNEICVTAAATAVRSYHTQLGYAPRFPLEKNSTYALSFYARAQSVAEVSFSVALPPPSYNYEQVFREDINLSSSYQFFSYTFNTENLDYNTTSFGFGLGNGTDNFYCFDDFILEKVVID